MAYVTILIPKGYDHFSEKISYPLGINIVFYLMTH